MPAANSTGPGLRTYIDGKADGPPIVFLHGWPDNHNLWDKQVMYLKDRYRCITTDLPGFSGDDARAEKWGYPTEEVVRRLERTIEAAGNGEPVALVAHDWGSFYAFKLEAKRPDLVRKMVNVDVGGSMKPGPLGVLIIISYQLALITAFLLGRPFGDGIAYCVAKLFNAPQAGRLGRAWACYPYYHVWSEALTGKVKSRWMMPTAPILYIHGIAGIKKAVNFESDRWLDTVSKKEGSSTLALPNAGHWVMRDCPDEFNKAVDSFLGTK